MPADISIGTSNGARAVALLNRQLSTLPVLRPLILVVKAFLREKGLNEVGAELLCSRDSALGRSCPGCSLLPFRLELTQHRKCKPLATFDEARIKADAAKHQRQAILASSRQALLVTQCSSSRSPWQQCPANVTPRSAVVQRTQKAQSSILSPETQIRMQVFSGGLSSYSIAVMVMAHLQAEGMASSALVAVAAAAAAAQYPDAEAAVDLQASPRATAADAGQLLRRFFARFGSEFRCWCTSNLDFQAVQCFCELAETLGLSTAPQRTVSTA